MASHADDHSHHQGGELGHSHGLVHSSIKRSRAGLRAVIASLLILGVTAALQVVVFILSGSIALLADLIHNIGDALTAVPLGVAFYESIDRLLNPQDLTHLWALAGAGVIGFLGNEAAACVRLRAGRSLQSPALVADGYHARSDGLVSLAVVASAILVALGLQAADPLIGMIVTVVILRITWHSFETVRNEQPGEPLAGAASGRPRVRASRRA